MFFFQIFNFSETVVNIPEFYVSNRGKCMLLQDGYRYTKQGENLQKNQCSWRCAYTKNARYVCKSYATTYYEDKQEKVIFRGQHYHSPMPIPRKKRSK